MPEKLRSVEPYSTEGQCVLALLHALEHLGGINSKQDSLAYLRSYRYFAFDPIDHKPYPSDAGTGESRWSKLVAFARNTCVERGWMFRHDQNDCWQIAREGRDLLARELNKYRSGTREASRCYFWATDFKKLVAPNCDTDRKQAKRPHDMYHDITDESVFDDII